MQTPIATAVALLTWGALAVLPWRLRLPSNRGAGEARLRQRWALAALPVLGLAGIAELILLRHRPDAAFAAGLHSLGSPITASLALLLIALAAANLLLWAAGDRLEPLGWSLLAGLGLLALIAAAATAEWLRQGEGPESSSLSMIGAITARGLMTLAAGETLAPGRPRWAAAAAPALGLYLWALPASVRAGLLLDGWWTTAVAAAALWLGARWLPPSLRRLTLAAAVALAALLLDRTADVSAALALLPEAPVALPGAPEVLPR